MPCNCENNNQQEFTQQVVQECSYRLEQIEAWKNLILCIRDNNHMEEINITTHEFNIILGTILSALRVSNPCMLKSNLDSIYDKIIKIASLNIC